VKNGGGELRGTVSNEGGEVMGKLSEKEERFTKRRNL